MNRYNVKLKCICICEVITFANNKKEATTNAQVIITHAPDDISSIDTISLVDTKEAIDINQI